MPSEQSANFGVALLLVDVISEYDFPGAPALLRGAKRAGGPIARLKRRARRASVPVIYANDNRGRWRSDFRQLTARATAASNPGREVVEALLPDPEDYFVLKPKQSAFLGTPLELLLGDLGVHTLVVAGFSTDGCITCTAIDAHLRNYRVHIPRDCVAASTTSRNDGSLKHLADTFHCVTHASAHVRFATLRSR